MKPGYNFIESRAIQEGKVKVFKDRLSIVEFIRRVKDERGLPLDVTVLGLDQLLYSAENREEISRYIKDLLIEKVNFLMRRNICVEFILEGSLEQWQHPIVRFNDEDLDLYKIFGTMERVDVNHFFAELNIQS